jgi:transaldolase
VIGGDVVLTLPASWQRRFNASSIEVRPRIDEPVQPRVLQALLGLEEFRLAYEPDALGPADFDTYGPTARTLRAFVASYHDLLHAVSDALVPDPDVRR